MTDPFRKKEEKDYGRGIYIRHENKRNSHFDVHKMNLTMVSFILGIMLFLYLLSKFWSPEYTSFITQESNRITVGENFYNGSILYFSLEDNTGMEIKKVKVSGTMYGKGDMDIYLVAEKRVLLIYSTKSERQIPLITGMAIAEQTCTAFNEDKGQKDSVEVENVDQNGFKVSTDDKGAVQKTKSIDVSSVILESGKNLDIFELTIVEDSSSKPRLRQEELRNGLELISECLDTCLIEGPLNENLYAIRFEMDKGMAFNLTSFEIY